MQGGGSRTAERELRALGDELDSCQVCGGMLEQATCRLRTAGVLKIFVPTSLLFFSLTRA